MYTPLLALTSLLAGRIALADQAITSPINGTTVQPGAQIDFRWYSDDDDDDNAVQFDVALISFVPLGSYSAQNRIVSETVEIPAGTPAGQYYIAVDEQDDDDNNNGNDLDDYDVRLNVEGQTGSQLTIIEVTSGSSTRRSIRQARGVVARQNSNNDNDDDEILYSPANLTQVAAGSSFNFTYRTDDETPGQVFVALVGYATGVQGEGSVQTTSERAVWEGSITVPQQAAPGQYYVGVFADDNEQPRIGDYELTFSSSAQLSGDDVNISGPEQLLVITVAGEASSSAAPSGSASASASTNPSATSTSGSGGVQSSIASVLPAASSSGAAGKLTVCSGGILGGLLAWAML